VQIYECGQGLCDGPFHGTQRIEHGAQIDHVERVEAEIAQIGVNLGLYYPSRRHMPAALRAFVDFVRTSAP
jgi:DNA-binding transcriptional LysR family regulator